MTNFDWDGVDNADEDNMASINVVAASLNETGMGYFLMGCCRLLQQACWTRTGMRGYECVFMGLLE